MKIFDYAIFTRDEFIAWQKEEQREIYQMTPIMSSTGITSNNENNSFESANMVGAYSIFVTFKYQEKILELEPLPSEFQKVLDENYGDLLA
jgi:hypothetical protein